MAATFRIYQPSDLEPLRALVRDPSLAEDFDGLQIPLALEAWLAEPFQDLEMFELAFEDGALAGFSSTALLNGREGRFAVVRFGVLDRHRRRGIASKLLERALAGLARRHPEAAEVSCSFWLPNDAAEAFSAAKGMTHVRSFRLLERPMVPVGDPVWPAGIRLAGYEATERVWRDVADAYNDSFAHHYHSIETTTEESRGLFERPGIRTDGLMLAYRGDQCVGFCRAELRGLRGEIAVLGTVQSARGIGLGRALLRWGVQWLERERAPRVTLLVDGENETALQLYRSEGFEIAQTRAVMSRERVSASRT
jgi:mycothiol synthase